MEKTIYVVTETVQDYKGACTNVCGATDDLGRARATLAGAVKERFSCEERFADEQNPDAAIGAFIDGHFTGDAKTSWHYFDGDTDYTFDIHKTALS